MIKKMAITLLLVSLGVFSILYFLEQPNVAWSSLFSSGLLLVNFIGLSFMWKFIVIQRSAGGGILLALLKYPIIGIAIFLASRQPWMNALGVVIGICEFLIIIVLSVLFKTKTLKD